MIQTVSRRLTLCFVVAALMLTAQAAQAGELARTTEIQPGRMVQILTDPPGVWRLQPDVLGDGERLGYPVPS